MEKFDLLELKDNFEKWSCLNFENAEGFEYFILDRDYIPMLEPFLDTISKSAAHHLYVRNSLQENLDIFDRGGTFLGIFDKGDIIALMICDPLCSQNEISGHTKLSEEDEAKSIALDTICVLPKYRGSAIQSKLMCIAEYIYMKKGYKYIFSTVSPSNYHSLQNFFKQDYVVVCITDLYAREKKNAVMRYIVSLEIGKKLEDVPEQYSVLNSDLEAQQNVISLGFVGMNIVNVTSPERFFISYSKAFYEDYSCENINSPY